VKLNPNLTSHGGVSAIGTDDQLAAEMMFEVIEIVGDGRSGSRCNDDVPHAMHNTGPGIFRGPRECLARLRVTHVERPRYARQHTGERQRIGLGCLSRYTLVISDDTCRIAASSSE